MKQLSEKFNASLHCIFNILHFHGARIREPSKGVRLRYNHVSIEPPKDFPWHLKEKFSKLIAVFLLTEGNVRRDGRISLVCKDDVLQRYYITLFRETFDLAPTLKSYMYKGKDPSIYSKGALSELLKLCPSYKTHPWNEDISRYLEKAQPTLTLLRGERTDLLKESIRLAMSAEGSVTPNFPPDTLPYPKMEFSCAHPALVFEWQRVFYKLNIRTYITRSKVAWAGIRGLMISNLESIKGFLEIGGFIKGVKVTSKSPYYAGLTKNKVLKAIFEARKRHITFSRDQPTSQKHPLIRQIAMKI